MDIKKISATLRKRWLLPTVAVLLIGFFAVPYLIGRACYSGDSVYVLNQTSKEIADRLNEDAYGYNWSGHDSPRHSLLRLALYASKRGYESIEDKEEGYQPSRKQEDWWGSFWCEIKLTDWIVAYFTFILAGATILLFWATEKLYVTGENQIEAAAKAGVKQAAATKVSLKVAKSAADAARDSANAAQSSVTEMRATAERQLRAYIGVDDAFFEKISDPYVPGSEMMTGYVHLIVKNYGTTPATDIIIKTENHIREIKDSNKLLLISKHANVHPRTSLPPGKSQILHLQLMEPKENMRPNNWRNWSANGTRQAYLWGQINYIDAFGKDRFVNFQMFADFDRVTSYGYCEHGNYSN
ncbi:MAG TPA: hypothetical protein VH722_13395 [Alphaproteobacteria bacterium]|nr:hypothetical protein [Alphaproteobacteria bacterium]